MATNLSSSVQWILFATILVGLLAGLASEGAAQPTYLEALRSRSGGTASLRTHVPRNPIDSFRRSFKYGECKTNYNFDYLHLALTWGPGFCRTSPKGCVRVDNKHFTIHGMWPTDNNSEGPEDCCFDNNFDYNSLAPLMNDLKEYWYSYFSKDSTSFWAHEWLKHGTCARDVPRLRGEKNYFGLTIAATKKAKVLETLKKEGIVPSNTKVYSSVSIQSALRQITGGESVQINCDLEHHQPIPVLTGISFCIGKDLTFKSCPYTKKACTKDLYFLNNGPQ